MENLERAAPAQLCSATWLQCDLSAKTLPFIINYEGELAVSHGLHLDINGAQ